MDFEIVASTLNKRLFELINSNKKSIWDYHSKIMINKKQYHNAF